MPLSPVAQYCIRKLLRQSIKNLNDLLPPKLNEKALSDQELDRILNNLYLDSIQAPIKTSELEVLTKLYQELEKTNSQTNLGTARRINGNETSLVELKRRIFQLLGFQTSAALPSRFPLIVQEQSTSSFRFYYNNRVREGIRYDHEIYGAIYRIDAVNRLQAYQLALALAELQLPLILTASTQRFVIWVNIGSPAYAVLLRQGASLLQVVLYLNSILRKNRMATHSQSRREI